MKKKRRRPRKKIELMMPIDVISFIEDISEITGVSWDDTINVILALEIQKLKAGEVPKGVQN